MSALLEINVISAQELAQISKSVRAYAVAWVHPERKLATQVDQEGHTNPTWNEKFMFRVDDHFLNTDDSVVMIEIYSSAWLRHVLIGTVAVLVSDLLPRNRKPKLRFVSLQVHGPSGRPQGTLNIGVGVTYLDSTMPHYSEISSSALGYNSDLVEPKKKRRIANTQDDHKDNNDNYYYNKNNKNYESSNSTSPFDSRLLTLQCCQSEKNDSTIDDYTYHGNDYEVEVEEEDSEICIKKGGIFNEELHHSYVRPSPSMVAAAIAKGLYTMPPPRTMESSTVDGWSENHSTITEGMKTKMERWRNELTPAYEHYDNDRRMLTSSRSSTRVTSTRMGKKPRRIRQRGGPYSCFGKMFGLEITISYAGGKNDKKRGGADKSRHSNTSSQLTFDHSYI